ncbi:MAG: DUF169 domain-containing protein [Desulfobacterales bacterium]|nr:DUF169 domain-containing protein [Desulfobacterales bacterium]
MSKINALYNQIIENMGVPGLSLPLSAVKFYRKEETPPDIVSSYTPSGLTLTSCQAAKQASLGDNVCLTKNNIGCIAAAITFGLVDENQESPMQGSRVYTDIMKDQSKNKGEFSPPSPKDFTEGFVYACKDANKPDFALFGKDDSGRYNSVETAKKAVEGMMAIKPADTNAVFLYSREFDELDLEPDVIVLSVRPVELARLIQAYQYITGERVNSSMGGLRVVNSDLIVRPYLTGKINISTYCLGARLIAQYNADRLGIGMPFKDFQIIARGMEESRTGFPFHLYPGSDESVTEEY